MKKGLLNAITLALVLINLVISIIMIFVGLPAMKKTANLVDKICTIVDLNIGEDSTENEVDITKIVNVPVKFGESNDSTISLAKGDDGKSHYIRVSVILSLNTAHPDYKEKSASIDTAMGLISSTIIDVVSKYSVSEVDKTKMEQEALRELQTLFSSDFIYSVDFNQFTVQ